MEAKSAVLKVVSKIPDIEFCAFPHQIVFGKTENGVFKQWHYFKFSLHDVPLLFRGLFYIVKSFSIDCGGEGLICKKVTGVLYQWKVSKVNGEQQILLYISEKDVVRFELKLSLLQFNDIVFLLGLIILPSLDLSQHGQSAFESIVELELEQILKFKQTKVLKDFLHDFKKANAVSEKEVYMISILVQYHLDIIVAIHCIKSLYNSDLNITNTNIDAMLSCT